MIDFLKKNFRLSAPSLLLLLLPYTIAHLKSIQNSPVFSATEFAILLFIIVATHICIITLFDKAEDKKYRYTAIGIYLIFFNIFYTADITNYLIELEFQAFGGPILKLRWLTVLTILLTFSLLFFLIRKSLMIIQLLNYSLFILSGTGLANQMMTAKSITKPVIYENSKFEIPVSNTPNKPVCLLILDGYSSPEEIFKLKKDTTVYQFSTTLKNEGWIVRNSIPSKHMFTELSLSSLFNFNLSEKQDYNQAQWTSTPIINFKKAALLDSLEAKDVAVNNFGIFPLGDKEPISRIYFIPRNTFELFISYTFLSQVVSYLSDLEFDKLSLNYYPSHIHNEKVLFELQKNNPPNKKFVYGHLYMPHKPYYYGEEFPYLEVNLENYVKYWKFTGKKINGAINYLKNNNYKVIIASDHGFRQSESIDKLNSFAAFYGFDSTAVEKVKSIQDIGILINVQFTK